MWSCIMVNLKVSAFVRLYFVQCEGERGKHQRGRGAATRVGYIDRSARARWHTASCAVAKS